MSIWIILLTFFTFVTNQLKFIEEKNYPVLVLHGIGEDCSDHLNTLSERLGTDLNTYTKCIDYTKNKVTSITESILVQSKRACDMVNQDTNFHGDFQIYAESQGTIVARYIIQMCNTIGTVKKFISIGGPHMGVISVPERYIPQDWIRKLIKSVGIYNLIYSKIFQNHLSFAGYFRYNLNIKSYLKNCELLPYLNNEKEYSEESKLKFLKLNKVVLVMFEKDDVINPKESSYFQGLDENNKLIALKDSEFYMKDFIGLRTLNERGELVFLKIDAVHIHYSYSYVVNNILKHMKGI